MPAPPPTTSKTASGKRSVRKAASKPKASAAHSVEGRRNELVLPLKGNHWRFTFMAALFALAGLLLVGRTIELQTFRAAPLKQHALSYRGTNQFLYSRGRILDRQGEVLAEDTLLYDLYAHPPYYKNQSIEQLATILAPILNKPRTTLVERLTPKNSRQTTVTLARNVPGQAIEALRAYRLNTPVTNEKTDELVLNKKTGKPLLKKERLNGLDPVRKPFRIYPQGEFAAHILGFVNDSASVSSGVEASAGKWLRSSPLFQSLMTDARGYGYHWEQQSLTPLMGLVRPKDVTLTLDNRLQHIAEIALATGIKKHQAERGTAIVLNPRNGELLAFASLPQFNPATFYKANSEQLKNWAITDVYPPGSTIKILTVACGLETGQITPESRILDTGRMKLGGWTIQNYDYSKHPYPGYISLDDLFVHSSNIGSAKIAMALPKAEYHRLLKGFGFGQATGLDVPGESAGLFPKTPSWDKITQATMGYGYGLASTPMQMAAAISVIANDGIWMPPHVIQNPDMKAYKGKAHRVLKSSTAKALTAILTRSIKLAPKHPANLPFLNVAGKTGTSRKPSATGGYTNQLYTSFVGYFPAEAPELLVMVVIDSPKTGEAWGSTVAAPIFREIALNASHYLGIKAPQVQLGNKGTPAKQ